MRPAAVQVSGAHGGTEGILTVEEGGGRSPHYAPAASNYD